MATIKSFTDLEQSKKLAEILTIESADMSYSFNFDSGIYEISTTPYKSWVVPKYAQPDDGFGQVIPCWSLAALLDIIDGIKMYGMNRVTMIVGKYDGNQWFVELERVHDNSSAMLTASKQLIDACVEMIIKLHDKKLL